MLKELLVFIIESLILYSQEDHSSKIRIKL